MVGLACLIDLAKKRGTTDVLIEHLGCSTASYWERMGFFRCLELEGPMPYGEYHSADGRFSEMQKVGDDNDTDDIAAGLVDTLGFEQFGREWQALSYILTELINNVCHHSVSFGYAAAQYYPSSGEVEICIGDSGIGLRTALSRWYDLGSDSEAIIKALEPAVTSNPPHVGQSERRNRGVGLTMVDRIIRASNGVLNIRTGASHWRNGIISENEPFWQGTIVSITVKRSQLTDQFRTLLADIKKEIDTARD